MSTILRRTAAIARQASRIRQFSSTTTARKDLVQDIYVREIKAYKAPPVASNYPISPTPVSHIQNQQAKDAHVGVVKQFNSPPSPQAPVIPSDLASELSAYDAAEPTSATAPSTTTPTSSEEAEGGAEQFLSFLEQDLPSKAAHH